MTEQPASNENGQQPAKQVAVVSQYIKDLSFENPRAPASILQIKERPQIAVNVDVKAAIVNEEEGLYEVAITLQVTAKSQENTLFVNELTYAGLFAIRGLNEAEREQTLLIYCPNILFPFARRIVADASRDGGFLPLMLDPIDFAQIYIRRKQQAKDAADKKQA